ncbi:MAG: UDP-glucose 4-epimerase GalE [Oscillospiraceae bacterium]|nr:UDP-glucose 4-epimerase GalE [Oscillospiraceae bacterium]
MKILVTGGAGYIGSHTCVELLDAGYEVVIVDDFSNSKPEVLERIREITCKDFAFYRLDVADKAGMRKVFEENLPDAVIHFAGFKAVGESVAQPLKYYRNNLGSTFTLCELMDEFNVKRLVFSSSATVYGVPKAVPIREDFPLSTTNPYGATKLMQEDIFRDIAASDGEWSIALLRYFNPIGAHKSGRIGEDPNGIPNNLMPYITQVAIGKRECLSVFGDDYDTPDGTGVRDYIHVVDLAQGHLKAVERVLSCKGIDAYNLGTGKGYSVLDMVHAFEAASGKKLAYKIAQRRSGDVAMCYADPSYAKEKLGWVAERELAEMCEDSWRWQKNNPNGYEK